MWGLNDFKSFINKRQHRYFGEDSFYKDVWSEKFQPQLEEIIKISLTSAWEKVEWRKNAIGLYGYDVIIDDDCKMWLLEINKCPTMEHSTKVTTNLVPKMLTDMMKVVLDWKIDRNADTGDYKLIFEAPYVKEQ